MSCLEDRGRPRLVCQWYVGEGWFFTGASQAGGRSCLSIVKEVVGRRLGKWDKLLVERHCIVGPTGCLGTPTANTTCQPFE